MVIISHTFDRQHPLLQANITLGLLTDGGYGD